MPVLQCASLFSVPRELTHCPGDTPAGPRDYWIFSRVWASEDSKNPGDQMMNKTEPNIRAPFTGILKFIHKGAGGEIQIQAPDSHTLKLWSSRLCPLGNGPSAYETLKVYIFLWKYPGCSFVCLFAVSHPGKDRLENLLWTEKIRQKVVFIVRVRGKKCVWGSICSLF